MRLRIYRRGAANSNARIAGLLHSLLIVRKWCLRSSEERLRNCRQHDCATDAHMAKKDRADLNSDAPKGSSSPTPPRGWWGPDTKSHIFVVPFNSKCLSSTSPSLYCRIQSRSPFRFSQSWHQIPAEFANIMIFLQDANMHKNLSHVSTVCISHPIWGSARYNKHTWLILISMVM